MASKRPSNPLALAVLVLLSERPMHPYQMSATLRERRKEDSIKINYGSLYSVVESLHRRGFIEARETVREGRRPERTVYAITGSGEGLMTAWLSELLSNPAKEFPEFEAALSLMPALPPDEVVSLLERRLSAQRESLDAGRTMLDKAAAMGMPRIFSVEHEYELEMLAAEVRFLENLLDDLRAGSFGGLGGWRRIHELRAAGMGQEAIEAVVREEFEGDYAWVDEIADSAE